MFNLSIQIMESMNGKEQQQYEAIQKERQELPIFEFRDLIVQTIKNNLYCVITGETGSGKSTQIAQYVIEEMKMEDFAEFTNEQIQSMLHAQFNLSPSEKNVKLTSDLIRVVVTQPRRVAAIQMAKRVSQERGRILGSQVGYAIRFEDKTSERTQIKYVTDGILVRECLMDPDLTQYRVVILDEAHERSLNTDILFALIKQAVLRRRGTLRLVITSATLKTEKIAKYYFGHSDSANAVIEGCPVLSVSGRCYPVSILHQESPKEQRVETSVQVAIRIHLNEPAGDVLVFLTGFEECEKACRLCMNKLQDISNKREVPPMMIVPLYGSQTPEQQANAFLKTPENCRKIIFATNIAETSLTVANIGYVIDSGYVKQKIYNPQTGMESLQIVVISKVQAIQRAGRAGRTREGKCVRLYTEKFYREQMPDSTVPEIKRVNLTSTTLTLKSMGIADVIDFDYLDKPDIQSLEEALKMLYYLEAIDNKGHLTKLGEVLSTFPLDPPYAKSLLAFDRLAGHRPRYDDMLTLVSVLSAETIWTAVSKNDAAKTEHFDQVRRDLAVAGSDHMGLVRVYDEWGQNRDDWCFSHFIQLRALKQARNIREQLSDHMRSVKWEEIKQFFRKGPSAKERQGYQERSMLLRQALSVGFFMNTARRIPHHSKEGTYLTVNEGLQVRVDRGSIISIQNSYPDWLLYTDLTSSGNSAAGMIKMASAIELEWVEDLIPRLKDVNVRRLCGFPEVKDDGKVLGKRVEREEQSREAEEQSKEMKMKELKERYMKRQKK